MISTIFKKASRRHYIPKIVSLIRLSVQMFVSGTIVKAYCWLSGFHINSCKFYGLPVLSFYQGSSVNIGRNCTFRSSHKSNLIGINHPCMLSTFNPNSELTIGDGCGFSGTTISAFKKVLIGNNVRCGANTVISDGDWHQDDKRSGDPSPIVIGNNVWIGLNSIVLKGVHIGDNSIIGAGSVVTKEIPANVIAAGNPCRPLKTISEL